jgi:hypothetical protein
MRGRGKYQELLCIVLFVKPSPRLPARPRYNLVVVSALVAERSCQVLWHDESRPTYYNRWPQA